MGKHGYPSSIFLSLGHGLNVTDQWIHCFWADAAPSHVWSVGCASAKEAAKQVCRSLVVPPSSQTRRRKHSTPECTLCNSSRSQWNRWMFGCKAGVARNSWRGKSVERCNVQWQTNRLYNTESQQLIDMAWKIVWKPAVMVVVYLQSVATLWICVRQCSIFAVLWRSVVSPMDSPTAFIGWLWVDSH